MSRPYPMITRSVPLIDIVRAGTDGRTVTAYAATFDQPYEVSDQYGHYDEQINRAAFNRALGRGLSGITVMFNHGRTVWGTPSDKFASPIGVPLEVKPDGKGLLTVTRYNNTPLADEVLELIDSGSVRFQSFRGPVQRSEPPRRGTNGRPVIERTQLGLTEYGPGILAVNTGAAILAVRSQLLLDEDIAEMDPDERRDLIARLQTALPVDPPADPDPQGAQPVTDPVAPVDLGPSVEVLAAANAQRRRRSSL